MHSESVFKDLTYSLTSYVEILESRLQKMEELVDRLQPSSNTPPSGHESQLSDSPIHTSTDHASPPTSIAAVVPPTLSSPVSDSAELDPSDDEVEATQKLLHSFRKFSIRPSSVGMRYHGKSSGMMLLRAALDMKAAQAGLDLEEFAIEPPETTAPSHTEDIAWSALSVTEDFPPYTDFPPQDLMERLIDSYFENLHPYLPIIHRQTLEQGINDGLHLQDEGFGSVVLLVCANAAGWLEGPEDPRLSAAGTPSRPGLKWFLQVEKTRRSLFSSTRLYDLQKYGLMAYYLANYGSPHGCWALVGFGLRAAQDVGVHREKTYNSMTKAEGELWKRAFWSLVILDRTDEEYVLQLNSVKFTHPDAVLSFDVEPLVECDDEYWFTGNPDTDFKQPPGMPSKLTYANCLSRLLQILAFASRTIYSINKSKLMLGFVGQEWEERIVADLDSALNRWIDTVPDHLRWDPHREDTMFLNQSAALYAKYYQLQILVHRPFLPSARKSTPLSLPSLAICTNAARSCVHVCDVQFKRTGKPLLHNRMSLFTASIVLLLNMWAGKKTGYANRSAAQDVQKSMKILKGLEAYASSARFWQVLNFLYSAGEFEDPQPTEPSRKRARDAEFPEPTPNGPLNPTTSVASTIAPGNEGAERRAVAAGGIDSHLPDSVGPTSSHTSSWAESETWVAQSNTSSPASFDLPMHTEDLGRIPFHHGFSPSSFRQVYSQSQQGVFPTQSAGPSSLGTFSSMPSAAFQPSGVHMGDVASPGFNNPYVAMDAASTYSFPQASQASQLSGMDHTGRAGHGVNAAGFPMLMTDGLTLADNTLEMWSSAPTSMDLADWGAFISNMSGGLDDAVQSGFQASIF
ncbi:fungal-specific transcription factor domain-containing protein [Trametes punicea]|nr:fungal-specific transcription factor domain-containing protein [Trametes punicea]